MPSEGGIAAYFWKATFLDGIIPSTGGTIRLEGGITLLEGGRTLWAACASIGPLGYVNWRAAALLQRAVSCQMWYCAALCHCAGENIHRRNALRRRHSATLLDPAIFFGG